jgi:drug/metabolite transporter (DMT)-like permease
MVSFKGFEKFKPHISQIIYQIAFAGMYIIARVSLIDGMNHFVFMAFRQAIATLAIAPFAYVLERKQRPPLTWTILFQIFLLASGITITQNCYIQGLYYTTSTFGSAAQNLLPMFTFAMATFLRLEKVNIRSLGGQAKVIGTVISVGGAMIMTLYKGPVLKFLSPGVEGHLMTSNSKPKNLVLGSILVFGSIVTWSASIVFQAPVLKRYPAQLSLTAFACLFGSLQSGLIAVIWERKKTNIWTIGWNFKLLGVVYSGIMGSALGMYVQAWCISKKGPVFVAIFTPLGTVVTAILELIILHVYLRVGSVVGAILIVLGLYTALWGKAHDSATEAVQESQNHIQFRAPAIEKEETTV